MKLSRNFFNVEGQIKHSLFVHYNLKLKPKIVYFICFDKFRKFLVRCLRYELGFVFQIVLQGIISLFLTMYGVMSVAGEFKEIRATVDLEVKSWESLRNLPSFYVFNHRGKALSPDYEPPPPNQKFVQPDLSLLLQKTDLPKKDVKHD